MLPAASSYAYHSPKTPTVMRPPMPISKPIDPVFVFGSNLAGRHCKGALCEPGSIEVRSTVKARARKGTPARSP